MKNNLSKYLLPAAVVVAALVIVVLIIYFVSPKYLPGGAETTTPGTPIGANGPAISGQPTSGQPPVSPENTSTTQPITPITMQLTSPAFNDGEKIPDKYTCDGKNISPPLIIEDIPQDTKSLTLIVDDPDAPAGDWVHWLVWNIGPGMHKIPEKVLPTNVMEGTTDFGKTGWGGPCPPSGTHHYQFKLYALDTILDLPESTKKSGLEQAMESHILEKTVMVGLYERK